MAIAFRAASSATQPAGSSVTVNKPTGVVDGDIMVMAVVSNGTATVNTPAGWTAIDTNSNGTINDPKVWTFYKVASGEGASYNVTTTASTDYTVGIVAYSGADTITVPDSHGANNSGGALGTSIVANSITTVKTTTMLIGVFCQASSGAFTPPGSMTERLDVNIGGGFKALEMTEQALSSSGATGSRTATNGSNARWCASLIALGEAGQQLSPSAIASAEAIGAHTVTPGAATVAPSGIASAGAFGTAVITGGAVPQTVSPSGIASAGAFGTATVLPGPVNVAPSGIASGFASGLPTVLTFGGPARLLLQIALNTGPGGSPAWTDLTDRLIDFDTFRGKNWRLALDERGTATFLLRNHDRALDQHFAAGPYFGNLKIRRRVRLLAVWAPPPAGPETTYELWHGFARRYRQVLNGTEQAVRLEALGPRWLTEDPDLPESALAAEVLKDGPAAWWPCGGTEDAGLFDRLGRYGGRWYRSRPAQRSIVPFHPGASVYVPRKASGGIVVAASIVTAYPSTWLGFVALDQPVNGAGETHGIIAQFVDPANPTTTRVQLRVATATDSATHKGKLLARVQNGGQHRAVVATGSRLDDGLVHTVMAVFVSSSSILLYVDGVAQGLSTLNSGTPSWPAAATTWTIGNDVDTAATESGNLDGLTGYLQELVIFATDQSARADEYHDAAINGWGSTRSGPRPTSYMVSKVLDAIGYPAGYRTIETGVTDVAGVAELPDSARKLLDRLTLTEDGRLYETGAGGLFFRSRDSYLNSPLDTVQATFGNGTGEVHYEETAPVDPADRLVTRARIGRVGGIVQQSDATPAQLDDYGVVGDDFTTGLHISDAFAGAAAQWRTTYFGDPRFEFERIVLASSAGDNAQTLQALTRELDDRIRVIRRPPPAGSAAQDVEEQIMGIRHRGNRKQWRTTFSLAAALGVEPYLEVGHATRGKLSDGRVVVY